MRVATKLTGALVFGIIVVMAAYAYLQLRQEVVLYEADLARARQLGLAWVGTLEAVLEREGLDRAKELMRRADARAPDVKVRLVALGSPVDDLPMVELSPENLDTLGRGVAVKLTHRDESDSDVVVFYARLRGSELPVGVELVEPLTEEQHFIQMSHLAIALATLAVVTVCALLASGLHVWLVGRPIERLRDKARRVGAGDFSGPLGLTQRDEIGELAHEIDDMCSSLADAKRKLETETEARFEAIEQLRHSDRLATVGRLAAGVAHELGTPLNVISARAEIIASNPSSDAAPHAGAIVEQAERMAEIIHQLLDFSRRRAATLEAVDLRQVVRQSIDLVASAAAKSRVAIEFSAPDHPVVTRADDSQLQQVLTNLILNAIQSMNGGGQMRVHLEAPAGERARSSGEPAHAWVAVAIEDNGSGIAPGDLPHIFEPFFTTKGVGEGTGLGLAVAHGIVTEHGGWIAVDSELGRGSRFPVYLHAAEQARAGAAA